MKIRWLLVLGALLVAGCVIDLPDRQLGDGGGGGERGSGEGGGGEVSPDCGNGVLDPGEQCDTAIAAGEPGACPTTCDDGLSCTADTLEQAGTCQARCSASPAASKSRRSCSSLCSA